MGKGRDLEIRSSDGKNFTGYLACPKSRRSPGVLIIHEIFGVNAHIRRVVEQFAAAGYVALAPDMFWRVQPNLQFEYTPENIHEALQVRSSFDLKAAARRCRSISPRRALVDALLEMSDVMSSVKALRALSECTGKVGVVGYCFGGLNAYLLATRSDIGAASCYYGGGIDRFLDEAKLVTCPIQFHFGSADHGISLNSVEKIRKAFAGRPSVEVFVYDGAAHGFNCDMRASFDTEASKLALERTLSLLRRTIGPF